MVDTADGALQETQALLLRMRELAVQASNGTLGDADKAALEVEADLLKLRSKEFLIILLGEEKIIGWFV